MHIEIPIINPTKNESGNLIEINLWEIAFLHYIKKAFNHAFQNNNIMKFLFYDNTSTQNCVWLDGRMTPG